jgi:hypothetical protein
MTWLRGGITSVIAHPSGNWEQMGKTIVILGGVAGMSARHELAQRKFEIYGLRSRFPGPE